MQRLCITVLFLRGNHRWQRASNILSLLRPSKLAIPHFVSATNAAPSVYCQKISADKTKHTPLFIVGGWHFLTSIIDAPRDISVYILFYSGMLIRWVGLVWIIQALDRRGNCIQYQLYFFLNETGTCKTREPLQCRYLPHGVCPMKYARQFVLLCCVFLII